jgi:hypothetical protein
MSVGVRYSVSRVSSGGGEPREASPDHLRAEGLGARTVIYNGGVSPHVGACRSGGLHRGGVDTARGAFGMGRLNGRGPGGGGRCGAQCSEPQDTLGRYPGEFLDSVFVLAHEARLEEILANLVTG